MKNKRKSKGKGKGEERRESKEKLNREIEGNVNESKKIRNKGVEERG